jgi:transposase
MASICGEGWDCKVQLKGCFKVMPDNAIEILGAGERRRRWSVEEKLRLVAECEEPGAVLRAVAARHDVYPTLLGTWRRQVRRGQLASSKAPGLIPVRIAESNTQGSSEPAPEPAASAKIEITLPDGCRVRVGNDVTLTTLRRVMAVLRG